MDAQGIEWRTSTAPVPYLDAVEIMEKRVAAIEAGEAPELIWFLEHPALYTAGTSADARELIDAHGLPVFTTGRGGRYTYHGPGQRVVYVLSDLRQRGRDVRAHVARLETWVIQTLKTFDVQSDRRAGRIGIWVNPKGEDEKIAAIGVRVRHWITYHGLAINVAPDLKNFEGIVPCGLKEFGVTSLKEMGLSTSISDVDRALAKQFKTIF